MSDPGIILLDGELVEQFAPSKPVYNDSPGGTIKLGGSVADKYDFQDTSGVLIPTGSWMRGNKDWENYHPGIVGYDTATYAKCERCRGTYNLYRWNGVQGSGPFCTICWSDITELRQGSPDINLPSLP